MRPGSLRATVERQVRSRFRSRAYWIGAAAPTLLISVLLYQTARATNSAATTMFLAIVSALWIGGSACVREIVDERKLVQREPHLSLLAYGISKIVHAALLAAGQSAIVAAFLVATDVVGLGVIPLWTIVFLTALSGSMLALLLSALCDEAATALAWFPLLLVPQVVFGGFLFPYGPTRPFALDRSSGEIVVMPDALVRQPVTQGLLRAAGALSVSRWSLETYAATVYQRDLGDEANLGKAIQVAFFVPLTFVDEPVSDTLLQFVAGRTNPAAASDPAVIDANAGIYYLLLVVFATAKAGLLIMVLPLRDPRRT
jgi:hypothetical protein